MSSTTDSAEIASALPTTGKSACGPRCGRHRRGLCAGRCDLRPSAAARAPRNEPRQRHGLARRLAGAYSDRWCGRAIRRKSVSGSQLSPEQQAIEKLWEAHLASEFKTKSAEAAINTMVERPSVNHVPVMTGGVGRKQLTHFYGNYFIPQMPPDTEIIPVSRTIGHDRLVDEFVIKFTHTLQMDWLLPGVPPTNKPVEVATVTVVQFQDGKMASERIYFDQASILVQLGLLDPGKFLLPG